MQLRKVFLVCHKLRELTNLTRNLPTDYDIYSLIQVQIYYKTIYNSIKCTTTDVEMKKVFSEKISVIITFLIANAFWQER